MAPEDVVYSVLPMYHTSGINIVFGSMIVRGTTMVLRRKFSASNFANDCFKHKCTVSCFNTLSTTGGKSLQLPYMASCRDVLPQSTDHQVSNSLQRSSVASKA